MPGASPAIAAAIAVTTARDGGDDERLTSPSAAARAAAESGRGRRAIARTRYPDRMACAGGTGNGRHTSHSLSSKKNRSGRTPTTV